MKLIYNLIVLEIPVDSYDFKLINYKHHTVLDYNYKINNTKANVSINDDC